MVSFCCETKERTEKVNNSVVLNGGGLIGGSIQLLVPLGGLSRQNRASSTLRWRRNKVDNGPVSRRLDGILVQYGFREVSKDDGSKETFVPGLTIDDLGHVLGEVELVLDVWVTLDFKVPECSVNVFVGCVEGDFIEAVCEDNSILHSIHCSLSRTWEHLDR